MLVDQAPNQRVDFFDRQFTDIAIAFAPQRSDRILHAFHPYKAQPVPPRLMTDGYFELAGGLGEVPDEAVAGWETILITAGLCEVLHPALGSRVCLRETGEPRCDVLHQFVGPAYANLMRSGKVFRKVPLSRPRSRNTGVDLR